MEKNVALPDDLPAAEPKAAQTDGKPPDELIEAATRRYLARERVDRFVGRNEERARDLGITESDVPRVVKEWRLEQHGRLSGPDHRRYQHLHLRSQLQQGQAPPTPANGIGRRG